MRLGQWRILKSHFIPVLVNCRTQRPIVYQACKSALQQNNNRQKLTLNTYVIYQYNVHLVFY